jgi:alpha-1,3-rhamnosyl/mannosyltransferase
LVIAGPPGRAEADLVAAIALSPERTRIHRCGRLSEDVLARVYADATCFVFPSLVEGFGMPPLEAMARGVPTLVADIPVLKEVTQGAALTFDPQDPEAIAAVVSHASESQAARARLSEAGLAVASQYRWDRTAGIVWSAIRAAVRG